MKYRSFHKKILFRLRFLTYFVIISVSLNIAFLATLIVHSNLEKQRQITTFTAPLFQVDSTETKEIFSNQNFLNQMKNRSFKELAAYLTDKEQLEEGYTKRDLALTCLVAYHDFNLEKVISEEKLQKREITFETEDNNKENIILFSGLSDFQYEGIIYFAYRERWPLTFKGIFSLIKKNQGKCDVSLIKTFMTSKEIDLIRSLFEQKIEKISNEKLFQLLLEVRWEIIDSFVYEQMQLQDLTIERQRSFLLSCLEDKSPMAAQMLLESDFEYVVKRLDDIQVLNLLELLPMSSDEVQSLCVELLKSSRRDKVWKASAEKLYLFAQEKMPNPYDHKKALEKFVLSQKIESDWKEKVPPKRRVQLVIQERADPNSPLIHLVKDGENLWKIARLYKVEMNEIRRVNHLENDRIFPGAEIIIPKNH